MDNKTTKYLYGASVQGIQSFIFQTNKLKEIAGASELVEKVCTTAFDKFGKDSIVRAAGNIKHIFDSKEDCEKAVLKFPKKVMEMAPGITISQAVVELNGDSDYEEKSDELEKKLRAQRNKAIRPTTLGLMAMKRAPSTGFPAIEEDKNDGLIDLASKLKRKAYGKGSNSFELVKKSFGEQYYKEDIEELGKKVLSDIDEIKDDNSWIAVIHADGNGLGNIIQTIGKDAEHMKCFSGLLSQITQESANDAYAGIRYLFRNQTVIPIRPIVLSGDDLTLICRADFAIGYTQIFLESFEKISKKRLSELQINDEEIKKILKKGLTACAGIAFIKASYPFHYAIDLAESLCKRAKNKAREIDPDLAPSCLMFHKVQDSFITDIEELTKRTLTPKSKITFEYGPYYCGVHATSYPNCSSTIDELTGKSETLKGKEGNAIKSHLRQWLSMLFDDVEMANQKMKRLISMKDEVAEGLQLEKYAELSIGEQAPFYKIPFYDILSLLSVELPTKKEKENK